MKVLTDNQYYGQIANIVREQNRTNNTYKPPQMVTALKDLFYEEVEGVPPISFNGIGENLLDYRIDGAVGGVGDLITDSSDDNYGKYKVPVVIKRKAKHTATLQLHDCLPTTMMLDAPEALYYAENGLVAGTYCFTIPNGYETAYGGGKTYNFTLTKDVEPGGQLTFNWAYNTQASNSKITSYKSDVFTVIESNISVAEGSAGTSLGTTNGESLNLNHIHRVRFGSNNYVQGAIRQFLNSSENVGSVWQPQTKFDRPPTWNSEMSGFLRDLDSNFLAVVGISRKVVGINNLTDGGGYVTFEDKFFLLSKSEVYGGNESAFINEGEPYPYYSNYSDLSTAGHGNDTNRIKNRNGSAQVWGLRTAITSSGSHFRTVNTTGGLGNFYANNKGNGIAPACNIELDKDYKYNGRVLNVKDQISVTKGNDILVFDVIGIDVNEEVYFESETTNIYIDNPIEENESISLSDTNTNIPTFRGTNILAVETTVQPSKVYVKVRKESSHEAQIRQLYESVNAELTQYKAQYGELGGE